MPREESAKEVIARLGLAPLPAEGGFFREVYRSPKQIEGESGSRSLATCIYYLVTPESFSSLHRLSSDEIYFWLDGDPVILSMFSAAGEMTTVDLGRASMTGHCPQHTVKAGTWQGTRLVDGGSWALLATVVTPGFEFVDFEPGRPDQIEHWPDISRPIARSLLPRESQTR